MDEDPQAFVLRTLQRYADIPHPEWEKMLGMHRALHLEKNAFLLRQGGQTRPFGVHHQRDLSGILHYRIQR